VFLRQAPRWWSGGYGFVGNAPFNKWSLLQSGRCMLLLLLLPSGHGGAVKGWAPAASCKIGGDRGNPLNFVLIQARGAIASAIFYRYDGGNATSIEEAFFSSDVEARRCLATMWSRSRWLGNGRWQKMHAKRKPTRCSLSFLGSDGWRTPMFCGGDTQVPDRFDLDSHRVFFVKCEPLSSNTRFLRSSITRGLLQFVHLPL
jgi:hypothetical protein